MYAYCLKSIIVLYSLYFKFELTQAEPYSLDLDETWNGSWFPYDPLKTDDNPVVGYLTDNNHLTNSEVQHDSEYGVEMGISNENLCDDGESNLNKDWDNSPKDYFCFDDLKSQYLPVLNRDPLLDVDPIPDQYKAMNICMTESITYENRIPTFGTHRPLWAQYGEYKYLPAQRWVHNLEYGAVVMLYHPCSDNLEVKMLKEIVKGCLYRHIITPSRSLTEERPLALVAWGARLEMSKVEKNLVTSFINKFALRGPNQTSRNGQFNKLLEIPAKVVSNENDTNLCPLVF